MKKYLLYVLIVTNFARCMENGFGNQVSTHKRKQESQELKDEDFIRMINKFYQFGNRLSQQRMTSTDTSNQIGKLLSQQLVASNKDSSEINEYIRVECPYHDKLKPCNPEAIYLCEDTTSMQCLLKGLAYHILKDHPNMFRIKAVDLRTKYISYESNGNWRPFDELYDKYGLAEQQKPKTRKSKTKKQK